ncbi:MAG: helix-turn-helix domain-containing protein [Treponema sp.]|nr:helix-turn-helix domain-containing protein [Treponema sp.]
MKSEPEPIRRILSNNIKKHRRLYCYTQEKLAEKAGLSSQTLNDIEGCRRWVSSKTLSGLAKALHLKEYQLLLPENDDFGVVKSDSSLKTLMALQKKVKKAIDAQFEEAVDSGIFR